MRIASISVCVITGLLTAVAIGLSIAALSTPAWQTVTIWEFKTEHQHGLWLDCTRKLDTTVQGGRTIANFFQNNKWSCSYKFEHDDGHHGPDGGHMHANGTEHKFLGWHWAVIALIIISVLTGFAALGSICCAPVYFACSVINNFALLMSVLVSFIAVIVAFINSHKPDSRFLNAGSTTYEQHRGYSYWLEVAAAFLFLLAFVLSVLHSGMSILLARRGGFNSNRTYPKNNNSSSNTAV